MRFIVLLLGGAIATAFISSPPTFSFAQARSTSLEFMIGCAPTESESDRPTPSPSPR